MSSQEFNKLLEVLPTLSPEQLELLRRECDVAAITAKRDESFELTEAELADQEIQRRLLDAGLLTEIKPPARLTAPSRAFVPIQVKGEPLSETIIRERR